MRPVHGVSTSAKGSSLMCFGGRFEGFKPMLESEDRGLGSRGLGFRGLAALGS